MGVNNITDLDQNDLTRLQSLRTSGLNILMIPVGSQPLSVTAAAIRANPILSQFKYVIEFGWLVDNACYYNGTCPDPSKSKVGAQLKANLSEPIRTAVNNSDLFVGYYLFDEPMIYRVPAAAQEFVYNTVRAMDPDIASRPTMSAHANWFPSESNNSILRVPTDKEILSYMSPNAQDIFLSSQYAWDVQTQTDWLAALNRLGFFNKPFIQIMPSFTQSTAGCAYRNLVYFGNTIKSILSNVNQLQNLKGFAYFSFWKLPRGSDFAFDPQNCQVLADSTSEHLQSEARVVDSRFAPEMTNWVDEYSHAMPLNGTSPLGVSAGSVSEVRNVKLSGGGFIGAGTQMIPPTRSTGMIKGFFQSANLSLYNSTYFVTQLGLNSNAECGNGVNVKLLVTDLSAGNAWSVPMSQDIDRSQGKVPFIVDLSPWNGHTIALGLLMDARGDANCDRLVMEHPRLVNLNHRVNPFSHTVPTDVSVLHPFTAQWTNDLLQTVSFGDNVPSNPANGYGIPDAETIISGGTAQNGGSTMLTGFQINPPNRPNSYIKAIFTSRVTPELGNSFGVAEVGLVGMPECGDGVTVDMLSKDWVTGYKKVIARKTLNRFSGISQLFGSLESTRGHLTEIQFMVKSNATGSCDFVVIGNPRIVKFNE